MENGFGPSWLSTWQAICEQEAQSKIRYKKFLEEWYKIETKMKLMDLRVDAMLKTRDEYLNHLFQKYPNWKPKFTSYGLRPSSHNADHQSDLYRLMEAEIRRSLQQRDFGSIQLQQPTFSQSMANSLSGPLMPFHYPSIAPTSSYMATQMIPNPNQNFPTSDQSSAVQMAELKTEMAQIKSRLEDVGIYLRELRHSAIELTTSVSRRSSMRDKDRRRAPIVERVDERDFADVSGTKSAVAKNNASAFERKRDDFVDQVKEKLIQQNLGQTAKSRYDEDDDDETNYGQKLAHDEPVKVQEKKRIEKSVNSDQAILVENTTASVKGPRFDFTSSSQKSPEPKRAIQAVAQPPAKPTHDLILDDNSSLESDSPPATASWLMGGGDKKPAAAVREQQQFPKAHSPKKKAAVASSPDSTPEPIIKASQPSGTAYQTLLGAVTKGQPERKTTLSTVGAKSEESDLDDLEKDLIGVAKSKSGTALAAKPRDVSLSDIFSFDKTDHKSKSAVDLTTEKPKTTPASSLSTIAKPKETAAATKPGTTPAEPDDFLKKLFPDKFAASSGGATKTNVDAKKKKPAFLIGDESDDDFDLPQGKKKPDDLDDDFFFK